MAKTVTADIAKDMRDKYVRSRELTHSEYWLWVAEQIGTEQLKRFIPFEGERVRKALTTDPHMNNLPLAQWDAQDYGVRRLAGEAGFPSWSLSDTVCTLKELARSLYA